MIISFFNEKGGTGKTTTLFSLFQDFINNDKSVSVLDLDTQKSISELLSLNQLERFLISSDDRLDRFEGRSKYLFIDTHGGDLKSTREGLINSDLCICPIGYTQIDLNGFNKTLATLDEAIKVKPNLKALVVLNRQPTNPVLATKIKEIDSLLREMINGYKNIFISENIIYQREVYGNWEIGALATNNKARTEIANLAKEIEKII